MSEPVKPALSAEEWAEALTRDLSGGLDLPLHQVAALALHRQSFGFTHAEADALRVMWERLDWLGWGELATTEPDSPHRLAIRVIQKVEALLPPRTPDEP